MWPKPHGGRESLSEKKRPDLNSACLNTPISTEYFLNFWVLILSRLPLLQEGPTGGFLPLSAVVL